MSETTLFIGIIVIISLSWYHLAYIRPVDDKIQTLRAEISALRQALTRIRKQAEMVASLVPPDGADYGDAPWLARANEELDTLFEAVESEDSNDVWDQIEALKRGRTERAETVGAGSQVHPRRIRQIRGVPSLGLGQSGFSDEG